MNYGLVRTAAPAVEPLTAAEAMLYVRQDHEADETILIRLIKAARERCERVTGRQLIRASYRLYLDGFPRGDGGLELPLPPLISVDAVRYTDAAGDVQTVDPNTYAVDVAREPGWLMPAYNESWPVPRTQANAVEVDFTCGYGSDAADVPEEIRDRLQRCVAHLYDRRGQPGDTEAALDLLFLGVWTGTTV